MSANRAQKPASRRGMSIDMSRNLHAHHARSAMIERRQAEENEERATDIAHSGHTPREPPTLSQAGLRTREWRILQGTAPSRASSRWYLPSFRLAYRCVGSAGVAFLGMLHRLPVSLRRGPKARRNTLDTRNSTLRLLAAQVRALSTCPGASGRRTHRWRRPQDDVRSR